MALWDMGLLWTMTQVISFPAITLSNQASQEYHGGSWVVIDKGFQAWRMMLGITPGLRINSQSSQD